MQILLISVSFFLLLAFGLPSKLKSHKIEDLEQPKLDSYKKEPRSFPLSDIDSYKEKPRSFPLRDVDSYKEGPHSFPLSDVESFYSDQNDDLNEEDEFLVDTVNEEQEEGEHYEFEDEILHNEIPDQENEQFDVFGDYNFDQDGSEVDESQIPLYPNDHDHEEQFSLFDDDFVARNGDSEEEIDNVNDIPEITDEELENVDLYKYGINDVFPVVYKPHLKYRKTMKCPHCKKRLEFF